MQKQKTDYFNELYDNLFDKVSSFVIFKCNDLSSVEDIVQEVFLELYKTINKKGINYIENPEAFVIRISKFKLFKHYNFVKAIKNNVANSKDGKLVFDYADFKNQNIIIEDKFITPLLADEVWKFLTKKPMLTQKIFVLYYNMGYTQKEIAILLSKSQSFVKHRLYRTLNEVRKIYKKEN